MPAFKSTEVGGLLEFEVSLGYIGDCRPASALSQRSRQTGKMAQELTVLHVRSLGPGFKPQHSHKKPGVPHRKAILAPGWKESSQIIGCLNSRRDPASEEQAETD